jgi:hypothetical protein
MVTGLILKPKILRAGRATVMGILGWGLGKGRGDARGAAPRFGPAQFLKYEPRRPM